MKTSSKSQAHTPLSKNTIETMRADQWLWAARFFKTRSIAKAAIEAGHVHIDGKRIKVSRNLTIGTTLTIRQGNSKKTVIVQGFLKERRPSVEAVLLYSETEESITARALLQQQRQLMNLAHPEQKPSKKGRREIERFMDTIRDAAD